MRGENGDGFSDNNISWCKEGGKEEDAWLARPFFSLPLHHFFPLRKWLAAGTDAADAGAAFMYLLGEPVPGGEGEGERGEGGKERSAGKQAEEDHHLVPVRLCVCACECLPPPSSCRSFPPSRTRRGRGGRGRMPLNNRQKTIVAPEGMLGWWKKWTVAEPLMRVYCYFGIGMGLCFTFPLSSSIIDDERVCRGLWTWMRGRGRGGILLPGSDRRRSRSSRSWHFEYHITA